MLPQAPSGITLPDLPEITFERLSSLFGELALTYGYRNFESGPDGTSATILGTNVTDRLVVQPGLMQYTDPCLEGSQRAADRADGVLKVAAARLGVVNILQLGVKWIFNVPCSEGSRLFSLKRLARASDDELGDLAVVAGAQVWPGVHYMSLSNDKSVQYSVRIEPLLEDDAFLYIDVDTGFSNVSLDDVGETVARVLSYAQGPVMTHIAGLREG